VISKKFMKMLTELGRRIEEHSETSIDGKYKKIPNRSLRVEEYNN